jgi:peptide/nickel transport system permease protein
MIRRLRHRTDALTLGGGVMLALLVMLSIVPLVVPGLDARASVGPRLSEPSASWWFGTDQLGRSILPRVLEGVRTTMLISIAAVIVATALATAIAVLGVVRGGWVDQAVVRTADALFAFPAVLLAIVIATVVGPGSLSAAIAIVVITTPLMVRAIRAGAIRIIDRDFVTTSYVGGASRLRIATYHVVPNIAGLVVVQATYSASIAMLTEGALSFLGFGVQAPDASLGSLVQEGNVYLTLAPWVTLIPGAVLAVAILSVNLVGDGLRDALDPRTVRPLT